MPRERLLLLLLLRLAGLAGVAAALCWITGDVLIVGHVADRAQFPLLFVTHADRIDAGMAERLVGVSQARLIAGALFGVFSMPLYLAGCWHLWRGIRGCPRVWVVAAIGLLFLGYAWSPLPHAAFYYVGAAYQAALAAPVDAQWQWLAQAETFHRVLAWTYYPAVGCLALGLLVFSLAVARGGSAYPRWFALTANPVPLCLLAMGIPALLQGPAAAALGAAGINIVWLLVYLQSLVLLWHGGRPAAASG